MKHKSKPEGNPYVEGSAMYSMYNMYRYMKDEMFPKKEIDERLKELLEIFDPQYRYSRELERTKRREYESNPENKKRFSIDYKVEDFIPCLIGAAIHEDRKDKKREENRRYYEWANEGVVSRIREKVFMGYQWLTFSALVGGIVTGIHYFVTK